MKKSTIKFYETKLTDAGKLHRSCIYRYGVYPKAAMLAVEQIAKEWDKRANKWEGIKELHFEVFERAQAIDAQMRKRGKLCAFICRLARK